MPKPSPNRPKPWVAAFAESVRDRPPHAGLLQHPPERRPGAGDEDDDPAAHQARFHQPADGLPGGAALTVEQEQARRRAQQQREVRVADHPGEADKIPPAVVFADAGRSFHDANARFASDLNAQSVAIGEDVRGLLRGAGVQVAVDRPVRPQDPELTAEIGVARRFHPHQSDRQQDWDQRQPEGQRAGGGRRDGGGRVGGETVRVRHVGRCAADAEARAAVRAAGQGVGDFARGVRPPGVTAFSDRSRSRTAGPPPPPAMRSAPPRPSSRPGRYSGSPRASAAPAWAGRGCA